MTRNTVEDCRQDSGKGIIPSIPRHSFRCGNFHIYRSAMGINHDLGLLSLLLRLLMDITMEGTTIPISEYVVSLLISSTRPRTSQMAPSKMNSAGKAELESVFLCCRETCCRQCVLLFMGRYLAPKGEFKYLRLLLVLTVPGP